MAQTQELQLVLNELELLETVTKAYGEIASVRMQKTRDSVLSTRDFLESLLDVFEDVRASYEKEVRKLARKKWLKGKEAVTFLSHNGKNVAVLLSANTGLYGEIVRSTFDLFLEEVRKNDCEVTIIGKQGLSLFKSIEPDRSYTYFDLLDYGIAQNELSKIIQHIVQYKEIHMYYGKFHNVLVQKPYQFTISAQIDLEGKKQQHQVRKEYIFEPSLELILKFFETEMFASLFEQSVRESQLAKFASRILAMDTATQNVQRERGKLYVAKMALQHRIANQRQLNALPGILMNVR